MSRSYRKFACIKDGYGSRSKSISKRYANKSVRKSKIIQSGCFYRKLFNPWDICDYVFISSFKQYKERKERLYSRGFYEEMPSEEKMFIDWFAEYKRK